LLGIVLGLWARVIIGVNERSADRVEVLLAVELVVGMTASFTRKRPRTILAVIIVLVKGGPVTSSIILSAALNVANRTRPNENTFILYWLVDLLGVF
jgi:hypothetical protein